MKNAMTMTTGWKSKTTKQNYLGESNDDRQGNGGEERFTGHGPEWTDANLSKDDAQVATVWVDQIINKRSMLTNKDRVEDVRDADVGA